MAVLLESNGAITYFSDFRLEIASVDLELEQTLQADNRTIADLVIALNARIGQQQRVLESEIASQLAQPSGFESLAPRERELLRLIRQQEPTLALGLRFSEGSLIAIGTITITVVLGNPTLRGLLLNIGSQLLSKLAVAGIQRGIRNILERFGWRAKEDSIFVELAPGAIVPVTAARKERENSSVSLGAPMTLLAVIAFLLFAIFVTLLFLGFAAHLL